MEVAEQEAEELAREDAQEKEDEDETLEARRSRRLVKGKAKVILPKI